jgi:hypothetical protein
MVFLGVIENWIRQQQRIPLNPPLAPPRRGIDLLLALSKRGIDLLMAILRS